MSDTLLVEPSSKPRTERVLGTLLRSREIAVAAVLLLLIVFTTVKSSGFVFSSDGWRNLLVTPSLLLILAVGQAVVIITRNVDLSVGSVLGISAFAAGLCLENGGHPLVAVLLAVALGALFGVVNGALVSLGKVPALVVTLGTLYVIRGIDSLWVGSRQITASALPDGFVDFGSDGISVVPYLALLTLAVLVVVAYYLRSYRSGRDMYALGSNPEAARLAGIPIRARVMTAYVVCGALAGLAGALYLARFGNVDSNTGNGYELVVVSAVVVGGVAFTGGSGTVYGAALGAVLLTSVNGVLPALGVSSVWVTAINGCLLLLAIAVDRILALRVSGALRKKAAQSRSARHA